MTDQETAEQAVDKLINELEAMSGVNPLITEDVVRLMVLAYTAGEGKGIDRAKAIMKGAKV